MVVVGVRKVSRMEQLVGKVAVVTGAASGIGLAMCEAFSGQGMRVVMADIEASALTAAARKVQAAGADVLAVVTDVSSAEAVEALAQATVERFGAAHLLCNNAGVGGIGDRGKVPSPAGSGRSAST